MNAGGRFGCVADALLEVAGVDLEGRPFRRLIEPGDLGYRTSVFLGAAIVTSASFVRDAGVDRDAQRRLGLRLHLLDRRSRRDLAQAKYNYILSLLRLKAAAGQLTEQDVDLVNGWLDR